MFHRLGIMKAIQTHVDYAATWGAICNVSPKFSLIMHEPRKLQEIETSTQFYTYTPAIVNYKTMVGWLLYTLCFSCSLD